jgi:superfamily II DNA/RNA helicase
MKEKFKKKKEEIDNVEVDTYFKRCLKAVEVSVSEGKERAYVSFSDKDIAEKVSKKLKDLKLSVDIINGYDDQERKHQLGLAIYGWAS